MLATFRRFLNTWVARVFFIVLLVSFGFWGIGDVVRNIAEGDGSLATVGGRKIDVSEVQDVYRRQLAQVSSMFGGHTDPTPEIRQAVAAQALERVVTQAALEEKVASLGIVASDDAVRQAVFDIPQFRGPDGKFNRAAFLNVLQNNNLTEQRFQTLMRSDLGQRQVMDAVTAGAVVPDIEAREVFAFQNEKRVADGVNVLFSAMPTPPEPTQAQLQRWYDNHPESYRTPELRRIKAVVLSPETVSKDIEVSDDDIKAYWDAHKSEYEKPEKRSVQILTVPDEAKAAALAAQWRGGADWDAMQTAAKADGATPVALSDAARNEFPGAELADAVFSAATNIVTGPVKSPLGWYVLRVTSVTGGGGLTFEQARDQLKARIVADRAADVIDDHANKLDQFLTSGTKLDDLPGDLGLGAVQGTMDAQGNTAEGAPAPIPGSPELRNALVQAAFAMKPGDPPRMTQAQGDPGSPPAYFAVQVEDVTPPAAKPFDQVSEQVKSAWIADATRHAADEEATRILTAVKGGQSLEDAATVAGLTIQKFAPTGRSQPAEGVPAQLIQPLFSLKKGEPTVVETPDGFVVAVLTEIQTPDQNSDPIGFAQVRDALTKAIAQDMQETFAVAVRNAANPRINRSALDALTQSGGE
jgi:peptidyl-prolyl cis-trans isomerase D